MIFFKKDAVTTETIFVEQKNQNERSILYSFDDRFQLLHADIANIYGGPKTVLSFC